MNFIALKELLGENFRSRTSKVTLPSWFVSNVLKMILAYKLQSNEIKILLCKVVNEQMNRLISK